MADATALLLAAASVACFAAFTWLALSLDAHWQQVQGRQRPARGTRRLLRALGVSTLVASLLLCLLADHASIAVLVWVMLLPVCAAAVAMTLAWRPTWLRVLWPVGGS